MADTVMVVGGGGREHAMAWALARSERVERVLVAPGNPGTAAEPKCTNVDVGATDIDAVVGLARREGVSLVAIGPEDPLVAGMVDSLGDSGIAAFGPSAAAARLEGSKVHCKEFLLDHGIATGAAASFSDVDEALEHLAGLESVPVVKASGLAAGKGVIVAETADEAARAVRSMLVDGRFGDAGAEVLLEERLHGTEVSILAFCDGTTFRLMPAAQDHKRLLAGDEGPNTGGMGAFHPSPIADDALLAQIGHDVIGATLAGLAAEGRPYRGVLYAGMMLTADGPKVIEFNCRFGDPETQVVLPLLESDLLEIFEACVEGRLHEQSVRWARKAAVSVVMASGGYPAVSSPPVPILGLEQAATVGCKVFHAGTSEVDGEIHASGGRVLAVTAVAPTLSAAADIAHARVAAISFAGSQHRSDIARSSPAVSTIEVHS